MAGFKLALGEEDETGNRFPHHLEKEQHCFLHQGGAPGTGGSGHGGPMGWAYITQSLFV